VNNLQKNPHNSNRVMIILKRYAQK